MKNAIKIFLVIFLFISVNAHVNKALAQLVNANATVQAKALKHYLDSINALHKIISGQAFEDVNENWLTVISDASGGKQPAIMGLDFMNSSPNRVSMGTDPNATTNKAIDWVKNKGGILEMHWHWDAPRLVTGDKWQAFYTKNTDFDVAAAMNDVNSDDYKLLVRDIDTISNRLLRLQKEGIALLWRPLHEAEGKWFWWGAKTGDACKKLYRMMYDRMVNVHGINNLIWVWNSYGNTKENWYPGDDVVDIIAWDYPDYNQSTGSWSQYQQLFGTKNKLFAIGEDGQLVNPDLLSNQYWLYFLTWAYMIKDPSQTNGKNTASWINQVFNDPRVITLDDLIPGPKAKAGKAQLIFDLDGNGTEQVTLDGSASSTNIGTITSYSWKENNVEIAMGVKPTVNLTVGVHTIVLTITTSKNETKSATVLITIKIPSLTLNKTITVSSTEASFGNVAANAVDGNETTRWSSLYSDPQWIVVDLGKSYDINRVVISWESASAKNYWIQVSDDRSYWSTVLVKSNMPAGARIDDLSGFVGSGRYLRIYGSTRNTSYGYSIFELEAYGTPTAVPNGLETLKADDIQIFPTIVSANNNLSIKLQNQVNNCKITILDSIGKMMKQTVMNGNSSEIFIDNSFSSGMYLINFEYNNKKITQKFFVK